ncbi:MAG TPA: class I SAM-dependent methyltransferase [Stellaceae bacterium]|jgi:SAM-dependent methyltransferase|nr:class I SAM-dependent methyltransferase [Stellaceae bacterium]
MTNEPFETTFTHQFVQRSLPAGCRRVLEVGAGAGELAARLMGDGLEVVALDVDPGMVAIAQDLGVDARVARWPMSLDEQFDVVLFTRSLHHIHPLAESVGAAAGCLAPRGRVVVEDFAFEAVDRRTLAWFTGAIRLLRESGLLPGHNELLNDLLETDGSPAAWEKYHDHDLHRVAAMEAELQRVLTDVTIGTAPYMFRYLGAAMANAPERDTLVRALAEQETKLIADGAITALGWRLCGALGAVAPG